MAIVAGPPQTQNYGPPVNPDAAETPDFEGKGLAILKKWVRQAEDAHDQARRLAHRDRDWYDNYNDTQWDEREKEVLKRRGQPIVTMNRIKRKVNFLCGMEQRSRTDPRAFPRKPHNHEQAQIATDVLDYIESAIRFDKLASNAFKDLCIEGISAIDICYKEGQGAYGITAEQIDFDQFFYDLRSRRADFSDARYLGYHNWYDLEDALALFPESANAEAALRGSLTGETTDEGYDDKPRFRWGDEDRQRVRVACLYYKEPNGDWHYAYFSGGGVLDEGVSKYTDENQRPTCPIIAASAYVTRENERYGSVRDMIGPQSEMNYRRSMSLALIKNRRVWSQAGVFNPDQNIKEDVAKVDAHIIANGQLGTDWGFIESNSEIAQNFELLMDAKSEIDAQGPNAGLQGRGVESQSGRAIIAQQQAGIAEENTIFDTHNEWKLRVYRAFWARAKQFWTEPMWLRIADEEAEDGERFTAVNQPDPAQLQSAMTGAGQAPQAMPGMMPGMMPPMGPVDPAMQGLLPGQAPMGAMPGQMPDVAMGGLMGPQGGIRVDMNRLAEMDVDIQIETAPDMISLQHEQFEQLTQMAAAGVPIPPDVLLEASQLRNKRDLVKRMREETDAMAKLAEAQQQMEQMAQAMQALEQQIIKLSQSAPVSPVDQAKVMDMQRTAERDDALAQSRIAKEQAEIAFRLQQPPPGLNGRVRPPL